MPDINCVLTECFSVLSREYELEWVQYIPCAGQRQEVSVPVWRLVIQAEIDENATDVEVFMAFPRGFPYELPVVIVQDQRFRGLPHISAENGKICLYENGVSYNAENIIGIIRTSIKRTRNWIELSINQDNNQEYAKEIKDYWRERYNGEDEAVDDSGILWGDIPKETCLLKGFTYLKRDYEHNKDFTQAILYSNENSQDVIHLKEVYKIEEFEAIYLSSIQISKCPPYSMTGQCLIDSIISKSDKALFKQYINKYGKGYIFFPINFDYAVGGVYISNLNVKRNGFRRGVLTPYKVITSFENKSKKLERLLFSCYNEVRIAKRTAGQMMESRQFSIAGLGSVGSNLCYYLNGYNNAQFTLIDNDMLSVDNIGRHLLGFEYLNQRKTFALSHYLTSYRPDRKVKSISRKIQEVSYEIINNTDALFLCTGDIMSEKWALDKLLICEINKPVFILWLEPYGVSGVMIYINPYDESSIKQLKIASDDRFLNYCLIDRTEYHSEMKLTQRDVGCNGQYALYSANDVMLFLSGMFPYIDWLINNATEKTQIYQWVGNIDIANQKNIILKERAKGLTKNEIIKLTPGQN
jgi:hypothetical protein